MPDFPIVDTHLHLWDPKRIRYPWLDGVPSLNRPHLLPDYRKALGPVKVERMVFLQCEADFAAFREEAAWVSALAKEEPRIQGIVPWAPLEMGEAARAPLAALAKDPLVKGIRRIIQFEADPGFCLRSDFVRGVKLLPEFGLHFEICIKGDLQFENTIALVRQAPGVKFLLDHIGKPDIKGRVLDPWRARVRELASLPNVWCKMSGLATEADFAKWTREDLKPYIDHVMECFGWDRVMFGGDWPVATQATDYPRWVATLEWAVAGARPADLGKLFRDNAVSFYRL